MISISGFVPKIYASFSLNLLRIDKFPSFKFLRAFFESIKELGTFTFEPNSLDSLNESFFFPVFDLDNSPFLILGGGLLPVVIKLSFFPFFSFFTFVNFFDFLDFFPPSETYLILE